MPTLRVNDVAPRVQYVADGVQTSFTVPFFFFDAADLEVRFGDGAAAAAHSVSGAGNPAGGAVLFVAPPPAGTRVTIWREMALKRGTEFQEAGAFRAATINDELDRLAMLAQELDARLDRAAAFPATSTAAPVALPAPAAGRYLRWTADGLGLESVQPLQGSVAVSPFAETLLDDVDAPAARATLGLPGVLQDGAHVYGAAAGSADALTLALSPALPAYAAGQRFWLKLAADNTGPVTLAVNGLAAKAVSWRGQPLVAGDLRAGTIVELVYDGAAFQLLTPPPGGWRLLKSLVASNSPTLDFPGLDASFDLYQLVLTNVAPVTDAVSLWVRVAHAGTYQAGTGYGYHVGGGSSSSAAYESANSGGASNFLLNQTSLGNASGEAYSGVFLISLPSASNRKRAWSSGSYLDANGVVHSAFMGGFHNSLTAVDGLRIMMSSGNISSGLSALYGLRC